MAPHKAADGIGGPPNARTPTQRLRTVIVAMLLMGCTLSTADAPDDTHKQVRRIRGIIDKDETWAGHVIITGDLQVVGATVTIYPGTLVEFADAAPGRGPALTVGSSAKADGGELRVMATPKEPVTFRTRSGTNRGRIIIHLHNRRVTSPRADPPLSKPATLNWQHIRFDQLGDGPAEPAIAIHLAGAGQSATITDCRLTQSNRLLIEAGDGATVTITNNRFRRGRSRIALEVSSAATQRKPAIVTLARNSLTDAILVDGLPAKIEENTLVGINAGSRPDRKVAEPTIHVRHNTFDGFGTTARAIHLNPTGRLPAKVSVAHNLFVRVRSLVFDESRASATLIHADHNAYAPPPLHPFDRAAVVGVRQGSPGWAASDIERQTPTELGLLHTPPRLPKADDEALLSGKLTIAALRAEYKALYRPDGGGPLVQAPGTQQIGAIATQP